MRLFIILLLIQTVLPVYQSLAETQRSDIVVLKAMETELNRSFNKLKLEGYEVPYFISYQIKDNAYNSIKAKYGAVINEDNDRSRRLFVDVRVGNYNFDNSERGQSGGKVPFYDSSYIPLDNDIDAIRAVLWQVTDSTYKHALTQYLNKKATYVEQIKEEIPSFTREKPKKYFDKELNLDYNHDEWREKVRELSGIFKKYKDIIDGDIIFTAQKETVYFINSEGSKYIRDEVLYSIDTTVKSRADDGKVVINYRNLYYVSPEKIPSTKQIKSIIEEMIEETLMIRKSDILQPVTAPALLYPEAAGVVFHEAIGHRLEGERQIDDTEGQTFKEKIGEQILPSFITILDDPLLRNFNGTDLMGFYQYDDQGVEGQRVVLVENGVLKNFLMSRTPIKDFDKSNGHGRSSYGRAPMARMSNTIIESDREYPQDKLKELLIEEVKKQNKPYGLIIKRMSGGETNTSSYNFQAFRAVPLVIYKVDPETGEETPVRDIEIVGTPLVSINKIIATGNNYEVFNGFCGAESGYVPVSTVAPSILLSEIEFQRKYTKKKKLPILPPPFFEEAKSN